MVVSLKLKFQLKDKSGGPFENLDNKIEINWGISNCQLTHIKKVRMNTVYTLNFATAKYNATVLKLPDPAFGAFLDERNWAQNLDS